MLKTLNTTLNPVFIKQDRAKSVSRRRGSWLGLRKRTWLISIPLHVVAFAVLYFAMLQLAQTEVYSAGASIANAALRHQIGEMGVMASLARNNAAPHPHQSFYDAHNTEIRVDLFGANGKIVNGSVRDDNREEAKVREFLALNKSEEHALESVNDRFELRIMHRLVAGSECTGCHQLGKVLGVMFARLDMTDQIRNIQHNLQKNLALMIAAWAALITLIAMLVERTAKRSAQTLRADLNAVESGGRMQTDGGDTLMLDPVSADLHHSLREFLQHRARQDAELAARMEHTDKLASVGQLAAGLAHEIRNPLAGIRSCVELLHQDATTELCRTRAEAIMEEIQRVDQTLTLLLTSARPHPPHKAQTDLPKLIDEIRRLMRPALRRRHISLRTDVAADVGVAMIDDAKIRQVLVNLINNAGEAMESGGKIEIRVAKFPEEDGIIIAVSDNGHGIPEELQQKIFCSFFTTKCTGTGLGLTIARRLVEEHGGRLEVQSTPQEGSTFLILLPNLVTEAVGSAVDKTGIPSGKAD